MKNSLSIVIFLLFFIHTATLFAQLDLPSFISDNMVLQQQSDAPIWGKSDPNTVIYITSSWDGIRHVTTADEQGKWKIKIKTPVAGGPYTIKINDQTINNILIGEVWLCSGQSNMQMALSQSEKGEDEAAIADLPNIRLFYVARELADQPKDDCYGKWEQCSPESAKTFSAVAYYFGKKLKKELDVPIGLIHTSWGGSTAEAWVREDILKSESDYGCYYEKEKGKEIKAKPGELPITQHSPSKLYNAMIHPLISYRIKGVIWYQGESNVNFCPEDAIRYEKLFPTLIKNWRDDWGQGDFPFYYAQIAPYEYGVTKVAAMLRDAQRKSLKVNNTGMAVTMDIGNPGDIHPKNKKDVGDRLALWALAKTYEKTSIAYSGPLYKSIKVKGNKALVSFDYVGGGLMAKNGPLTHFEIAGEDKQFYPAIAEIAKDLIVVKSEKVNNPVAVRYAFNNSDEPNLYNKEGLPASSFRTDDWKIDQINKSETKK
jgi:sialate O-acetylesterase